MNRRAFIATAVALTALAPACSEGGERGPACPDGAVVAYEGHDYCVVGLPIIETGFRCPPQFPFGMDGGDFRVCGQEGGLPPADVAAIGLAAGFGPASKQLDILLVVDNSGSMCGEQLALADAASRLAGELSRLDIDARVAVTTHDMQCAPNGGSVFSAGGAFNTHAASTFPPACQLSESVACRDTAACTEALGDGPWSCRRAATDACTENPNGSINTSCRRHCTTDSECQEALGDERATCQKLSGNPDDYGCLLPPATAGCDGVPGTGEPWLARPHLNDLRCLVSVGVNQESCYKYEQGLGAAWAALDPIGPNALQSAGFLRPEAHLAILIVSDEDDCSVAPGATVSEDDYETCSFLKTVAAGGPLLDPAEVAQRFI